MDPLDPPLFVSLLLFLFFTPAFLCRCGERPTSAVFFFPFFFFGAAESETEVKYTGPFIRASATVRREREAVR